MCVKRGVSSQKNLSNKEDMLTDYNGAEINELNTLDDLELASLSHDAPTNEQYT